MPNKKHAPARFRTYRAVHEKRLDQYIKEASFVQEHGLRYDAIPGHILIIGQVACLGNIVLTIEKYLAVLDAATSAEVIDGAEPDALVQTTNYSYNASIRGASTLLRFDNAHAHAGHPDKHHRHDFDWRDGRELRDSPKWVGEEGWPTLGEFIDEVAQWYWEHQRELPNPDSVATIETVMPRLRGPSRGHSNNDAR